MKTLKFGRGITRHEELDISLFANPFAPRMIRVFKFGVGYIMIPNIIFIYDW